MEQFNSAMVQRFDALKTQMDEFLVLFEETAKVGLETPDKLTEEMARKAMEGTMELAGDIFEVFMFLMTPTIMTAWGEGNKTAARDFASLIKTNIEDHFKHMVQMNEAIKRAH